MNGTTYSDIANENGTQIVRIQENSLIPPNDIMSSVQETTVELMQENTCLNNGTQSILNTSIYTSAPYSAASEPCQIQYFGSIPPTWLQERLQMEVASSDPEAPLLPLIPTLPFY